MKEEICIKVFYEPSGQRMSNCTTKTADKLVRLNRAMWMDNETILMFKSKRKVCKKRSEIIERDSRICYICDRFIPETEGATIDHVLPKALGGTDDDWNLRCCCRHCNNLKGGKSLPDFINEIKKNRSIFPFISPKQLRRLEGYAYQFHDLINFQNEKK